MTAIIFFALPALPEENGNSTPPPAPAGAESAGRLGTEEAYRKRAEQNPLDAQAFAGMAVLQLRRRAYSDAIASYRRVLELTPHDHDAKVGLGRALAFDGQFAIALQNFQELLVEHPGDTDALEEMARVQLWSGNPADALSIFHNLAARYPANPEYEVGLARAETNLHQYRQARETLAALLTAHPGYHDGELQLAYLDLYEGRQADAWRRFNRLIRKNPTDTEALLGNARVAYYRGDLVYARNLTEKIVAENPQDPSTLLLLANIERALHNPKRARVLLYRAERLDPHSVEGRELENSLRNDSRPTFHTSMSFAREEGSGSPSSAEDLTSFGYESTWGLSLLPRSESYLSVAYLPSQSPSGGIEGAAGPSELFYRQTSHLTPQMSLRCGIGLARFGPGESLVIPSQQQPITAVGMRPLGFAGMTYRLRTKLTIDLTARRNAVTYTPTAVRLGVVLDQLSLGWDYRFNRKTDLRFEPYFADYSTTSYNHITGLAGDRPAGVDESDHYRTGGASVALYRTLFQKSATTVDLGYSGLAFEFLGGSQRPYLGFFNPGFYQRHYLTTHFLGRIHGPLGYDFSGGAGIQQVERGSPLKLALLLSPAFTLKASPRLWLSLGYTHYNSAQSLGSLSGNAVRLSTDWKF
jgi:tetratricopeptide (TPR) repeat protein